MALFTISGDDVFAEETAPRFPGARFVITKSATGHASGVTQTPASARDAIENAAREVVRHHIDKGDAPQATRAAAKPVECELRVQTTGLADLFCQWPTLTRVDAVTLRFGAESAGHAVRMLNCLSALSFMLR